MSDVVISYNGSDIAEMSETGTKTLNTQGTYLPSDIQVRYTSPMDNANFIPGIESETYEVLFGGEFTVTTATDATHDHPHAETGITGRLDKRYLYRVTFDGVEYILPSQLVPYKRENAYSTLACEYVGDVSLFRYQTTGLLNEELDVPFMIISDDEDNDGTDTIGVYTSVAGTYTILVEKVVFTFEEIPEALIYGNMHRPYQYSDGTSAYQIFSVGANRILSPTRVAYAFGHCNTLSGDSSFAIGNGNKTNAQGAGALGGFCEATGIRAIAENYLTKASGHYSHAENYLTESSGMVAHAEGYGSIADGTGAHAENLFSIAKGGGAHAEGYGTRAYGNYSHTEGGGTYAKANQSYCHIGGVNNDVTDDTGKTVSMTTYKADGTQDTTTNNITLGKYAEVIGNGDSDQARSNARTLDWNGNEAIAGSLTLGLGTQGEITLTPAQLATIFASLLPAVSASDNGKVLQVVNGAWAAATIPSANGVNF